MTPNRIACRWGLEAEQNAAADRAGITVFRGILSLQPARRLSVAFGQRKESVTETEPAACKSLDSRGAP